jgi:hypothetical protein
MDRMRGNKPVDVKCYYLSFVSAEASSFICNVYEENIDIAFVLYDLLHF